MTATYNPRPAQSSPFPTTWIQDGGAVFAEPVPNDRHLQSAPLPVQSLSKHVDPRWRRVCRARFPMTATKNMRPSQSSPTPTHVDPRWRRCVCGTGSHRYLQSAPRPVQSLSNHVDPRWRRRCVCGTGSLSNCPVPAPTLHPSCPPSPVPIQPRGYKMAAVLCLRNRFSGLAAQFPLQLCTHHAPPSPIHSNHVDPR